MDIVSVGFPTYLRRRQGQPEESGHLAQGRWSCGCQDADGVIFPLFRSGSIWSKFRNPEFDASAPIIRTSRAGLPGACGTTGSTTAAIGSGTVDETGGDPASSTFFCDLSNYELNGDHHLGKVQGCQSSSLYRRTKGVQTDTPTSEVGSLRIKSRIVDYFYLCMTHRTAARANSHWGTRIAELE